jgi:hypothetical protein
MGSEQDFRLLALPGAALYELIHGHAPDIIDTAAL